MSDQFCNKKDNNKLQIIYSSFPRFFPRGEFHVFRWARAAPPPPSALNARPQTHALLKPIKTKTVKRKVSTNQMI